MNRGQTAHISYILDLRVDFRLDFLQLDSLLILFIPHESTSFHNHSHTFTATLLIHLAIVLGPPSL